LIEPAHAENPARQQAGFVYHVINRGNGRASSFHKDQDYHAFLSILGLATDEDACLLVDTESFSPCDRIVTSSIAEPIHVMAFGQSCNGGITSITGAVGISGRADLRGRTFANGAALRSAKSG